MSWIVASLVMFFSSIGLYLLVRKSQRLNISNSLINLAMSAIPCIGFFIIAILGKISLTISWQALVLLVVMAFFFSYLGNLFSLVSIQKAPNPGYSLIISKSYVVFTTLVAVFLFNSHLSLKNGLAIIAIIVFSSLVMISKTQRKTTRDFRWLIYAFGSFFCWGLLALTSKYLINNSISIVSILFYLTLFVSIFILVEMEIKKTPVTFKHWYLLIFIGISSLFFNLFMQLGYVLSPNIGYINTVNASSISLVTLLSAYFFKDELSVRKIIGILGVTASLILLFL